MKDNAITREQVYRAAEVLVANGKKVTNENIREQLGDCGSYSTIGPLLRDWKEDQKILNSGPTHTTTIPPRVTEMAVNFSSQLWCEAEKQAASRLEEDRLFFEQESLALRAEYREMTELADRLIMDLEEVRTEAKKTDQSLKAVQHAYVEAQANCSTLKAEVSSLKEELKGAREGEINARELAAELKGRLSQSPQESEH